MEPDEEEMYLLFSNEMDKRLAPIGIYSLFLHIILYPLIKSLFVME